jgi:hypothetical protein
MADATPFDTSSEGQRKNQWNCEISDIPPPGAEPSDSISAGELLQEAAQRALAYVQSVRDRPVTVSNEALQRLNELRHRRKRYPQSTPIKGVPFRCRWGVPFQCRLTHRRCKSTSFVKKASLRRPGIGKRLAFASRVTGSPIADPELRDVSPRMRPSTSSRRE